MSNSTLSKRIAWYTLATVVGTLFLLYFAFDDMLLISTIFGTFNFLSPLFGSVMSISWVPFIVSFVLASIPFLVIARNSRLLIETKFLEGAFIWLTVGFFAMVANSFG